MDGRRSSRIFVFSHPRTTSNLLFRIMESHPSVVIKQYPFGLQDVFLFDPENSTTAKGSPMLDEFHTYFGDKYSELTFQKSLDDMETWIRSAELQNKFVMIKEHTVHLMTSEIHAANIPERRECQPTPVIEDRALDLDEAERTIATSGGIPFPVPNPTFLPDRLIKSLTPVFLIRHPGRVFPSFLRASTLIGATVAGGNASLYLSFKWQRIMFDFYKAWYSCPRGAESARPGRENLPIVIDGDKLIDDPQGQIRKMCQLLGLDPAPVQFSWEKKEKFESPAHEVFLSTIGKSTGVIKNKDSKPINLEEEAAQWAKEWDKKTAQELKIRTEEAMEDYNYLLKESI